MSSSTSGALRGPGRADRSRRSSTADQIKELILGEGLRPGDPLPTETELCERLDVSRSSVREAVRTLVTLDIVEVRHGHGTFVGNMSLAAMVEALVFRGALSPGDDLQALREVIDVRQMLDLAVGERLVTAMQGSSHPELDQLVTHMVNEAEQGRTFADADRVFHTRLLNCTGNGLLGQLVGAFWDVHTAVLPKLGLALPSDLTETAAAHGRMVTSAEAGDLDGYLQAVRDHYDPLLRALAKAV